jgi:hypothetical protein
MDFRTHIRGLGCASGIGEGRYLEVGKIALEHLSRMFVVVMFLEIGRRYKQLSAPLALIVLIVGWRFEQTLVGLEAFLFEF